MAALKVLCRLKQAIFSLEEMCSVALGLRLPPRSPVSAISVVGWDVTPSTALVPEKDFGILWAVPRNRRTVEKRWKRKFGSPYYISKLLAPKENLLVCNTCGHYHEAGVLCAHCYAKVAEETKAAQTAVQEQLGLSAVDREVVLLYEDEPPPSDQSKRVVEVRRPRPQWFSRNLLQRSSDVPSPTALSAETEARPISVKPSELG